LRHFEAGRGECWFAISGLQMQVEVMNPTTAEVEECNGEDGTRLLTHTQLEIGWLRMASQFPRN